MATLRFMCSGRINKPLPATLVSTLPAIKEVMADLQTYAQKLNKEDTDTVLWGNEVDYIWFNISLAIPMPLPQVLQDKLPVIRNKIRGLKTYAINTGEAAFQGTYHICKHGDGVPNNCSLTEQEI